MAVSAHAIAPDLSLTVGWSSAEAATEMTDLVDGVTFHDFLTIDQTGDRLATVRAQELTDNGLALQAADGVFVWTLDDFSQPDQAVVGRWPWHKSLQKHYGLFDDAGQGKPAAAAIRSLFTIVLKE